MLSNTSNDTVSFYWIIKVIFDLIVAYLNELSKSKLLLVLASNTTMLTIRVEMIRMPLKRLIMYTNDFCTTLPQLWFTILITDSYPRTRNFDFNLGIASNKGLHTSMTYKH